MQCGTVAAGVVTFQATEDGAPATEGEEILLTLPEGLLFVDGGSSATVTTGPDGMVTVPAFRALGASGSYSIQASFGGGTFESVSAFAVGDVTPRPGTIAQLTRTPGSASVSPTITAATVPGIQNGVTGAISGDQSAASAGANVAIVTQDGLVRYWGRNFGVPTPSTSTPPATLQYNGANVSGVRFVDTWTSVGATDNSAGGTAAGTAASSVYQWYRNGTGTGTPSVVRITGISGTVRSVEANERFSYALTSNGIYYWSSTAAGSGTPRTLSATGPIADTTGATSMSTWSTRDPGSTTVSYGGGVLLANGAARYWAGTSSADSHALQTTSGTPSNVASFESVAEALYILTADGELYTQGTAFRTTSWTRRATGVSTFHAWGYAGYTGGLYVLSTGELVQFFAARPSGRAWATEARAGSVSESTVTKVFASDGTYLALTSDSRVHAWAGNLDSAGRTQPRLVDTVSNASDLQVWGFHQPAGDFYGGGYVISSPGPCA